MGSPEHDFIKKFPKFFYKYYNKLKYLDKWFTKKNIKMDDDNIKKIIKYITKNELVKDKKKARLLNYTKMFILVNGALFVFI